MAGALKKITFLRLPLLFYLQEEANMLCCAEQHGSVGDHSSAFVASKSCGKFLCENQDFVSGFCPKTGALYLERWEIFKNLLNEYEYARILKSFFFRLLSDMI